MKLGRVTQPLASRFSPGLQFGDASPDRASYRQVAGKSIAATRWFGLFSAAVLVGGVLSKPSAAAQTFVGSDSCKQCHEDKWNDHRVSGHPYELQKISDVDAWPLPLPKGYDWADVSYVVGGFKWKAVYLDSDGYIITSTLTADGSNQYNVATGEWVDYAAGEQKQYDCGECHATGYSAVGNQDGRLGIVGTWALEGIQCESCHGPASDHVTSPSKLNISINDNACNDCHSRGDTTKIPATGGFVREHQQYNELRSSPHFFLDCVTCHDPHQKAELSIRTECTVCHSDMKNANDAFLKLGRRHVERDVTCVDCHMPFAAKSAVAVNKYKADLRSHLFRVTLAEDASMFNPDGTLANGALTADYACLGCHENIANEFAGNPKKAVAWARKNAKKIHQP